MNTRSIKRVLSLCILLVYLASIFSDGLLNGIHLLSHASEILTDSFSVHKHGNGAYHVHHRHNILEVVDQLLNNTEEHTGSDESQNMVSSDQFKFHLPVECESDLYARSFNKDKLLSFIAMPSSIDLDALEPPPKI